MKNDINLAETARITITALSHASMHFPRLPKPVAGNI